MNGTGSDKLIKHIRQVPGSDSPREVFAALVTCFASALAEASGNDCDWLAERAKAATSALSEGATESMPELCARVVEILEENPDQDLLGVTYTLLGLGDARKGQFFTPYELCKTMATMGIGDGSQLDAEIERRGFVTCSDDACGCGAMLVAAANHMREVGVNYQEHAFFVAQDIDELAALACYVQMSLLGMPGRVAIGNTLTGEVRHALYTPILILRPSWIARMSLWMP